MTPLRIGELFSGIGGASLAVHAVIPDAVTLWQSDLVNEKVRARHFPDAQQLVGDVRALNPATLPHVDLLTAGFPCTDLSEAGKRAGLDGKHSGLYREVLRFADGLRPERVLMENVPALLHYMPRLCADFRARGYGLTWTLCEAADAGLPHLRSRVFVLAEADVRGRGIVEVDNSARWTHPTERTWRTPLCFDAGGPSGRAKKGEGSDLCAEVAMWPEPADPRIESLPEAELLLPIVPVAVVKRCDPLATDKQASQRTVAGKRLSPAWVEALMGYPVGWTEPEGDTLPHIFPPPVRGRYPAEWDRSVPWPGFDWEPSRTLPDGPKAHGRAARLKALGNSWVPAQGALALRALLGQGEQLCLL